MSNTPFRWYKERSHEGGIASPFIVRWPGFIKDKGKLRRQICHIIDIVPTCLDAAGLDHSIVTYKKHTQKLEGVSLLPFFKDELPQKSRTLFWEHMGNRAVRIGNWKLVSIHKGKWELYNMHQDRTELNDLSKKYPDRAGQMLDAWNAWAKRCGVQPWPIKKKKVN